LIVVLRPSRPTLSQEEKGRGKEGERERAREGEKEGGRGSREGDAALSDATASEKNTRQVCKASVWPPGRRDACGDAALLQQDKNAKEMRRKAGFIKTRRVTSAWLETRP